MCHPVRLLYFHRPLTFILGMPNSCPAWRMLLLPEGGWVCRGLGFGSAGDLGSCLPFLHHPHINSYSRKIARASPCHNLGGSLLSWALLVSSTRAGTFPFGGTCTVEAGRLAVNQSMSLLNYSSIRKSQAWQMHKQIYSSVYRDTGDFLPPFLAIVSWAGKKQKCNLYFS